MINSAFIAPLLVAFVVTVVFIVILRPVAKSVGLIDTPGGRKSHVGDVPIVGGIAMFAGICAALVLVQSEPFPLLPFVVACGILVLVGAVDDKYHVPASIRMSAQIAVVLIMVYGADLSLASIGAPFGMGEVYTGPLGLILTLLVALTTINAYNLVDGIDGLAGSLALVALLAVASVATIQHPSIFVSLIAIAAIVAFLIFNFPTIWNRKARCFMGDAGSTLLGFIIVWAALQVSQGADRVISPVLCLWFASVPVYDLLTCFVRRAIRRKSPFTPGRDHYHHALNRGGFGVRESLGILTGLQLIYTIIALVAHAMAVPDVAMFIGWSLLGVTQRSVIMRLARQRRAMRMRSKPA